MLDIERGQLSEGRESLWQTDTSISVKSWGYIKGDTFRSTESLIQQLVDIVSKNGCLLLNVGPKPDGTIPEEAQRILLDLGKWLAVNGEAVYGTRPWTEYGEGPTQVKGGSFNDTATKGYTAEDIRFTQNGSTLYATVMGWPRDGKLTIKSLAEGGPNGEFSVGSVQLLGVSSKILFTRDGSGLHLQVPAKTGEYAYVFRIAK